MGGKRPITVAKGDGIGPEIMDATLHILEEAGAQIEPEFIEIGEKVYNAGYSSGITEEAWESLHRTGVFLKAPITTPQGGGFKSLNVTVRRALGLYANVRPAVSYHPVVPTNHPNMDVVIIRENEEDSYGGIEHQQTPDLVQCLRIITRQGSERIIRFAFEYARRNNRKKVTCMTKDNIMKMTDGLFHKIFDEIAAEYPDLETEHWIIDIGMAKLADTPENFDVIVMPNLYGDIASDVAAQVAGSVGLAGGANIGDKYAMFEAIHGSAPRRAGQGIANPSGLLLSAIMMLVHIGQPEVATRIHNAWLRTLEDGVLTYDLAKGKPSVGTMEFARGVTARLGKEPQVLKPVSYAPVEEKKEEKPDREVIRVKPRRELVGVDVYLYNDTLSAQELGQRLEKINVDGLSLTMIDNRGLLVYPGGFPDSHVSDQWRCRFERTDSGKAVSPEQIRQLLKQIEDDGLEWTKLDNLYEFDGKIAYSLGQGQ